MPSSLSHTPVIATPVAPTFSNCHFRDTPITWNSQILFSWTSFCSECEKCRKNAHNMHQMCWTEWSMEWMRAIHKQTLANVHLVQGFCKIHTGKNYQETQKSIINHWKTCFYYSGYALSKASIYGLNRPRIAHWKYLFCSIINKVFTLWCSVLPLHHAVHQFCLCSGRPRNRLHRHSAKNLPDQFSVRLPQLLSSERPLLSSTLFCPPLPWFTISTSLLAIWSSSLLLSTTIWSPPDQRSGFGMSYKKGIEEPHNHTHCRSMSTRKFRKPLK